MMVSTNIEQELSTFLHADDFLAWDTHPEKHLVPLDVWVHGNIVHAMESCRTVFHQWRTIYSEEATSFMLCRLLSATLDTLIDKQKIAILKGVTKNAAEKELHHFIKGASNRWEYLSPSWSGEPGSRLRKAATKLGWVDVYLLGQVAGSIANSQAQRWSQWVPYPHSMQVLHHQARWQSAKRSYSDEYFRMHFGHMLEASTQTWASSMDAALALALCKQLPEYGMRLTPHPNAVIITGEMQSYMDSLVSVHIGLGMFDTLKSMIVQGALPVMEKMPTAWALDLPDLVLP